MALTCAVRVLRQDGYFREHHVNESMMHMPIEKQIADKHGFSYPLRFFEENPHGAYEMCMRTEDKLTMAYAMRHSSISDSTRAKFDLERIITAKDETLKHMQEKNEAEQRELKLLLARANNEILKLAHSLSVRGMLEKIE